MSDYTIEARSLRVVGVASHDFWVLRNERGEALAELHGLATERKTNTPQEIGTDEKKFSLRAWHLPIDPGFARSIGTEVSRFTYIGADQMHMNIFSGPKQEVMARWNAAVAAKDALNALDLNYPYYGIKPFNTVNSNSAYRTLGEVMGLPIKDFPGVLEPGIDQRMTTQEHIDQLKVRGYPVLEKPSTKDGDTYKETPDPQLQLDPTRPGHPDHTLYQQALYGVHQLDAGLGRTPDEVSLRMAMSLTLLAKESGLQRIDHILLSSKNEQSRAGENVFIVQGKLDDPAHLRADMKTQTAVEIPVGIGLARLQQLNETQRTQLELVASIEPSQFNMQQEPPRHARAM